MSAEAILTELAARPQNFEVGTVVAEIPIAPRELDLSPDLSPIQIVRTDIYDPNIEYLEATRPGRVRALQSQEQVMNDFSRARFSVWRHHEHGVPYAQTERRLDSEESIASGDPVSRARYFNDPDFLGDDALRAWRSTVPTAIALAPLANPFNTSKVEDNHGQLHDVTEYAQEWMTACTDGWEIRNRTALMVESMSTFLSRTAQQEPTKNITVVSVAGGTALATMQAIMHSGVGPARVELILLESSERSATMAFELAEQIGFTSKISLEAMDVFSPAAM